MHTNPNRHRAWGVVYLRAHGQTRQGRRAKWWCRGESGRAATRRSLRWGPASSASARAHPPSPRGSDPPPPPPRPVAMAPPPPFSRRCWTRTRCVSFRRKKVRRLEEDGRIKHESDRLGSLGLGSTGFRPISASPREMDPRGLGRNNYHKTTRFIG